MKLKEILNRKNLHSFFEGTFKYYIYNKFLETPKYLKEQIQYRLYKCKDDCVKTGKCKECGCPTEKKVFVTKSCNKGERFPDLMNKEDWSKWKKENE